MKITIDITKKETLRFVVIIRPGTDMNKLAELDKKIPHIQI